MTSSTLERLIHSTGSIEAAELFTLTNEERLRSYFLFSSYLIILQPISSNSKYLKIMLINKVFSIIEMSRNLPSKNDTETADEFKKENSPRTHHDYLVLRAEDLAKFIFYHVSNRSESNEILKLLTTKERKKVRFLLNYLRKKFSDSDASDISSISEFSSDDS